MNKPEMTLEDLAELMEQGFTALSTQISGVEGDVSALKSDVSILKEDVAGLKEDMRFVKTKLVDHDEKLDVLIERDSASQKLFDQVFPRLDALERRKRA